MFLVRSSIFLFACFSWLIVFAAEAFAAKTIVMTAVVNANVVTNETAQIYSYNGLEGSNLLNSDDVNLSKPNTLLSVSYYDIISQPNSAVTVSYQNAAGKVKNSNKLSQTINFDQRGKATIFAAPKVFVKSLIAGDGLKTYYITINY